jgi:hypothetical protein
MVDTGDGGEKTIAVIKAPIVDRHRGNRTIVVDYGRH